MPKYKVKTLDNILESGNFYYPCPFCDIPLKTKDTCKTHIKTCNYNPDISESLDNIFLGEKYTVDKYLNNRSSLIKLVKTFHKTHILAGYEDCSIEHLVHHVLSELYKIDSTITETEYCTIPIIDTFFELNENERKELFDIGVRKMMCAYK
jgi:hypothetical protein